MKQLIKYITIPFIVLLFYAFPSLSEQYATAVSLFLIVFIGIPHGAADHIIFSKIGKSFFGARNLPSFIIIYILIGIGFMIIWSLNPFKALVLFILISIYHFGQEHFEYLPQKHWISKINIGSWGAFVLLFPLLWNFESTAGYIEEITGHTLGSLSYSLKMTGLSAILLSLFVSNYILWKFDMINLPKLKSEYIQIILLSILFLSTPLIVGFSIYFVFWHSLDAMEDQYIFLKKTSSNYSLKKYIKDILPLSCIAISFVLISGNYMVHKTGNGLFSFMIIIIAIITLPHILLFERMYSSKNQYS